MDLTNLDSLQGALEKLQSLRPPSPPEVVNGHLGVWRTIRHNRLFIEMSPGGKQGKVLIGPPSFVGSSLANISDETWANMTPQDTLKDFSRVKVAENGVETLKEAIKNALGPDDTRRDALKSLTEPLQLVPMARRTGFTDDEIKNALSGHSPNEKLTSPKTSGTSALATPSETPKVEVADRTSIIGKPPVSNEVNVPKPEEKPEATSPKAPATVSAIDGALALIAQPAESNGATKNREAEVGARLDRVWPNIKDELASRKIQSMALGLKSGLYSLSDIADKLREMKRSREALTERNTPTPEQITAMEDHGKVKEFIETFDAKVETAVDEALKRGGQSFTGQQVVEETKTKEQGQELPAGLKELIDENKAQRAESSQEQQAAAEADRKRAQQAREEAAREDERASAQRRAAAEAMSASQKERMQETAIVNLLEVLASQVKSPNIKKEIAAAAKESKSGSYNRGHLLMKLYRLLQLLLLLIPGL